jgi:hypothetical protein
MRIARLKEPDRIDPMTSGLLNLLERVSGHGKIFHCRFCRLQFFDRRELAPARSAIVEAAAASEEPLPQ